MLDIAENKLTIYEIYKKNPFLHTSPLTSPTVKVAQSIHWRDLGSNQHEVVNRQVLSDRKCQKRKVPPYPPHRIM